MIAVAAATPEHAEAIRRLDGLSQSTARVLEHDLAANDRCCLVAVADVEHRPDDANEHASAEAAGCTAGVVGYAAALIQLDEAHVIDVVVAPASRRRGIATMLLDALDVQMHARGAVASTLEVATGNLGAQQLYRQRGYVVEGRRPKYYPDGQDALILWRRDEGT